MEPRELSLNERQIEIPSEKIAGILQVFDQILGTQGEEAQKILVEMRGRRGRSRVLTFGELVGLSKDTTIDAAAIKVGITDLGAGPMATLAQILPFIADPLVPICESCKRYAVSEEGGVFKFLFKEGTRCPFKECGALIRASKNQEKPFVAWTTLEEMAPNATHDRTSIDHTPLPLRNDIILAESGKGLYQIDSRILEALRQEEMKTENGDPDIARLLMYLAHGEPRKYFSSGGRTVLLDRVLESLETPKLFGARDTIAIQATVMKAKGWKPGQFQPPSPTKPVHGGSGRSLNLTQQEKIQIRKALGIACRNSDELKMMVRDIGMDCGRMSFQGSGETIAAGIVEEAGKYGDATMRSLMEAIMERAPVTKSELSPLLSR